MNLWGSVERLEFSLILSPKKQNKQSVKSNSRINLSKKQESRHISPHRTNKAPLPHYSFALHRFKIKPKTMHWKKMLSKIYVHTLAVLLLFLMNQGSAQGQNGPVCNTYTNVVATVSSGLGDNIVYGVYASGSTIYAATFGGLSISTDGGASFTNKTTTNGLGNNTVKGVYASGSMVYAATSGGLSISTDGGASFTNKTTTNGLGSNTVKGVYASGSMVYAATSVGVVSPQMVEQALRTKPPRMVWETIL